MGAQVCEYWVVKGYNVEAGEFAFQKGFHLHKVQKTAKPSIASRYVSIAVAIHPSAAVGGYMYVASQSGQSSCEGSMEITIISEQQYSGT